MRTKFLNPKVTPKILKRTGPETAVMAKILIKIMSERKRNETVVNKTSKEVTIELLE